ncbi:hypothetical protein [Lactiplantibacillus plantarum]|uniref:hypothetical protein n=1 Tax=Lactiplantibacillus plantarum TaxID=1590 RepID=UPI00399FB7D7
MEGKRGSECLLKPVSNIDFNPVLSDASMKTLSTRIVDLKKAKDEPLVRVYQEILEVVNKHFTLFDDKGFRANLNNFYEKFKTLPVTNVYSDTGKLVQRGQRETLNAILRGLHANMDAIKYTDKGTPLGKFQTLHGIQLAEGSVIQYTSPAGLKVKIVKLRDL